MKIAYLNPVGVLGGAERVLLCLMEAVRETRPEARLHLIVSTEGPLIDRAAALRVHTHHVPMHAALAALGDSGLRDQGRLRGRLRLAGRAALVLPSALRYLRQLRQVLREIDPDVIHSNGIKTHVLTPLLRRKRAPVVWHLHDFSSHRPIMARALRWAARSASLALAISRAVGQDAQATLGRLPVELVYNAIDLRAFAPAPGDGPLLDRLSGLPPAQPGTVRVGLVATYARWKGQDVFLEAAARVQAAAPDPPVRFYVVGGPIYRTAGSQFSEEELRGRAAALGIAPLVGFIGFREDPAAIYQALDLVVHASTRPEPFGLTIVEAMACGRPVIACQEGGAAELFTSGQDAVGVPPRNPAVLAEAILELRNDPARRQRMGACARETALAQFGRERLGPQTVAIYERLLAATHTGPAGAKGSPEGAGPGGDPPRFLEKFAGPALDRRPRSRHPG